MKKFIGLFVISLCLIACSKQASFSPEDEDLQQAKNVVLFESKDSQNKWILKADSVDFEDMEHAVLTNPHLILREEGVDTTEVSGKRGLLNYSKKLVTIDGDARVHSLKEKALLTTERFFYDIDKDRIWSDKKTFITRTDTKITAKGGIETDSKLRKIEFKQQTTQLPADLSDLRKVVK